jgi:hypothetical protein
MHAPARRAINPAMPIPSPIPSFAGCDRPVLDELSELGVTKAAGVEEAGGEGVVDGGAVVEGVGAV